MRVGTHEENDEDTCWNECMTSAMLRVHLNIDSTVKTRKLADEPKAAYRLHEVRACMARTLLPVTASRAPPFFPRPPSSAPQNSQYCSDSSCSEAFATLAAQVDRDAQAEDEGSTVYIALAERSAGSTADGGCVQLSERALPRLSHQLSRISLCPFYCYGVLRMPSPPCLARAQEGQVDSQAR